MIIKQIIFIAVILICIITIVTIFIQYVRELNKQFKIAKATTVKVACAGSVIINTPNEVRIQSLENQMLYDKQGHLINIDDYDKFWVKGWSMLLCGIKDNNLLLTKKVIFDNMSFEKPHVLVLRRDSHMRQKAALKNDLAEFKVRRTWAVVRIGEDNITECIRRIISTPNFRELKAKFPTEFLSDTEMIEDFKTERYNKYVEQYPDSSSADDGNHLAIISTTLKVSKGNKVTFSIHPARIIEGEVAFSFQI